MPDEGRLMRDETLDLLYEHVRGQTAGQLDWSDHLDSKGMQLFAAASIVVGLAGLSSGDSWFVTLALFWAVASYVAVAVSAFGMMRVRDWFVTGHADVLWAEHWDESPRDIKHAIVEDAARAVKHNRTALFEKARWLQAIQILVTIEVVIVGVAVLADRLVP